MSVTIDISNTMATLWDGDTVGTWTNDDGTRTFSVFTTGFREATGCLGIQVSSETVRKYQTFTSFDARGELIYVWVKAAGDIDDKLGSSSAAGAGIEIGIGDGTNRKYYGVGGSDYAGFNIGSWSCFVLDPENLPTASEAWIEQAAGTGEVDITAITQVGVGFTTLSKSLGGAENMFIDIARHGTGIEIKGGTSGSGAGTFAQAAADDASTADGKAYGVIRELAAGVYGVQGQITIGDETGATTTYFEDNDLTEVVFEDTGAGDRQYLFKIAGNSTGTNYCVFGSKIDGATADEDLGTNGVIIRSAGPDLLVDLEGANMDTLNIYGTTIINVKRGVLLPNATGNDFVGNIITGSGQVDGNVCRIRALSLESSVGVWQDAIDAAVADDGGSQTTETTAANNDTRNDVNLLPATPATNDAYYFGGDFKFDRVRINITNPGAGNTIVWEYYEWNIAGAGWTTLIGAVDGTSAFANYGTYDVTFDPPTDWIRTTVNSIANKYWIRARVTTAGNQAQATRVWLMFPEKGALLWNGSINIKNSSFNNIVNADTLVDGGSIEHPTSGTFNYNGMSFSGNDADVVNSVSSGTVVDSYDISNFDSTIALATVQFAAGQTFANGSSQILTSAVFVVSKTGSPTGSAYAKLYAITGTHGTDAVPTGSPLATSEPLDVSKLSTTVDLVSFAFTDNYTMAAATNYAIVVEYTNGDVSNYIRVGTQQLGSPSHGGNFVYYTTSWIADNTTDCIFYVVNGGQVTINATDSNPANTNEIGYPFGSTVINNSVNLEITVQDEDTDPIENVQTAIYDTNGNQLMNEDTNVSGIATEAFNYPGSPVDIEIRLRKNSPGDTRYVNVDTTGQIGSGGFTLLVTMQEDTVAS
jgi:hypothetical protein